MKNIRYTYKAFPASKTAWDSLSMQEKSEMMKVAVKNGITDLKTIREKYNEFAEGGYLDWKEKASKYKHLDIDNDRTYDYEGWYNENPQRAWDFLNDNPDAHFDDKYKTAYHPTFSTQSRYSGVVDPVFNPDGLVGGTWNKQGSVFTMSPDGYRGPVSMDDRKWYLENTEDNGVQLREADGSLPIYDGIPWGGVLPNVTIYGNKFAKGGPKKKATSGWYQQHQNRWYNFLKNKGLSDADSARLSGFFTAQDDLESAGGRSSAARQKNNFGGMQKGGKNITYNSVNDYMEDKWRMMNSKFKPALSAKNIDEYATILGNPETAGKGYLYYVTDKVKYNPKDPAWQAAQRQHMQNYINGMRSRAGQKTVTFTNSSASLSQKPIVNVPASTYVAPPIQEYPDFTPLHPEVFQGSQVSFTPPILEEQEWQTPVTQIYSPEETARQEKAENLRRFSTVLGLLNASNGDNSLSGFLGLFGNSNGYFAKGGDIHIKPSHRGRLTELKARTGKTEAELYNDGNPAHKKMVVFARNARKWHGLGGNLFDGESQSSQQMEIGRPFWQSQAPQPLFFNLDFPVNGGSLREVVVTGDKTKSRQRLQQVLDQRQSDYLTASNDNIWIDSNLTHRSKNPHLSRRAEEGAKVHAAWEKEHPNLTAWGNVAGAIPFAVASVPVLAAAGEAAAPVLMNPYVDAAFTSLGAAHGAQSLANGNANWMTALELLPAARVAKPIYEGAIEPGMRLFNSPLTGNWTKIGNREYRLSPNSLGANGSPLESRAVAPQITAENATNMTPEQLDVAYKAAVESGNRPEALRLLEQAYLRSGIPRTDVTVTPDGHAVGWYHGSEWGNHTIFDSSAMNATIGGASAHGKVKGNFLTTDVPSAMRYAGSSRYSSANVPEYTSPQTFSEKVKNLFGVYKPRRLYPAERVGDYAPKPERLFDTKGKPALDHIDKVDNVVYPLYVNPGKDVMRLDFQGKPWSQSPVDFPNNFYLKRHIRDDVAKTYRDEIVPYKDYETAYKAWIEDPINIRHGSTSLDGMYFDDGIRSIEGFNSAPRYETVRLMEERVPNTTNGAVQTAAKEGKTSVLMRNVIDSNGGPEGAHYAIDDFVTFKPNQQKLADITYDDSGNLIPLSQRFNWLKDDVRYGLLPFGIGLTGYGLWNKNE